MTKFEFFESGLALTAVKLGLMDIKFLWRYDLYKTYLSFVNEGFSSTQARKKTIEFYNEEYLNVARAIYLFEPGERSGKSGRPKKNSFHNVEKKLAT